MGDEGVGGWAESNIQVKHEDLTKRSSRIEYKMRGKVGRPFGTKCRTERQVYVACIEHSYEVPDAGTLLFVKS